MKKAPLAPVQPRAGYYERSISFSTACTVSSATSPALPVSSATLPALPVRPWRSCMKISTHALSLERAYGKDLHPMFSMDTVTVDWSTVQIHSHEVMLGDNPSVSSGPPLGIEWKASYSRKLTVDEYEERSPPHRSPEDLRLPKAVRGRMLRKQGYTPQQLKVAQKRSTIECSRWY
jgi:hypothetical protein